MTENLFVKGLLIAVIFGIPAGPIGALSIQRTLEGGFFHGFVTGLGSAAADLIYSAISVYGITWIADLLFQYQFPIRVIGCILILIYSIITIRKQAPEPNVRISVYRETTNVIAYFTSAFLIAMLNPATILSFTIAFTTFGIPPHTDPTQKITLMLGVLVGAIIWWCTLNGIVALFRKKLTNKIYRVLNIVLGIILMAFAVGIAISVIVEIV